MANITVRRGNEPPIIVSEQAWNDVYSRNGFTIVSGSQSSPASSAPSSQPVQSSPVQSYPAVSTSTTYSAPVQQISAPPGYVRVTDEQVRQINAGNSSDFEELYPISSVGGGIVNVVFYAKPIPKTTVVNQQGQRITVRTDNKPGTILPTLQEMTSRGYRQERAPGVPMEPFSNASQNTQQVQTSTAVDQRQNPVILLSSGQIISAADPNYSQYLQVPGSIQINPQTNQVIPTIVGNVQTFADGSQLNIQTGQPIRGTYSGQLPPGLSTMPAPGSVPSGATTPIPTAPQQPFPGEQMPVSTLPASGTAFTNQHLVKFSSDPNGAGEGDASTVWLVDGATRTLRPFMSMSAINNYFGSSASQALASIVTMPVTALSDSGSLARFRTLDHTSGIQSDGTVLNPSVSVSSLQNHYGNSAPTTEQERLKSRAIEILKSIKMNTDNLLANGTLRGFTQQSLNAVFSDSTQLARLINAVAFGGYNGTDITKEAMRLAMVKDGRTELANQSLISDTQTRSAYSATEAYRQANALPALAIPGDAAQRIMAATTRPEAFQEGVVTDLGNLKANIDKIGTTYYDLIEQANSATTEREHQMAQTNWDNFRKTLQSSFGITLAKNAVDAWGQIQSLQKTAASGGLAGSGIANEQVDQYLKQVRASDRIARMDKLDREEKQEMAFYTSSASPEQIAALIAQDRSSGLPNNQWKSVKYGLVPSEELRSKFDVEAIFQKLKQDKPDQPDWLLRQQAQLTHDSILDRNGNFMSTLYGNLMTKQNDNAANKLLFQQGAAIADINKRNNAIFDQYTDPGLSSENTFSQPVQSATSSSSTTAPAPSSAPAYPVTSTPYVDPSTVRSEPYVAPSTVTSYAYTPPPVVTSEPYRPPTVSSSPSSTAAASSAASVISSSLGSSNTTTPSSSNVSRQKQILKGEGTALYSWDGTSVSKIPDVAALQRLVSQGYADTRAPLSSFQNLTSRPTI